MRVKTAKRLGILISVVILVGATGFYAQRYQLSRLAKKEFEKATLAFQEGDFARAEALFRDQCRAFPDDVKVQVKHADAIVKASRSPAAQAEADQIYTRILKRSVGRDDVRQALINLKLEMGGLVSSTGREDGADVHVKILLDKAEHKDDPHLVYLMGRCEEAKGNDVITGKSASRSAVESAFKKAVEAYGKVLEQKGAPDRVDVGERDETKLAEFLRDKLDAGERLAVLLRDKLDETKKAEAVINKLVDDRPLVDDSPKEGNRAYLARTYLARAYLARGRFWLGLAARDESQKALEAKAKQDFERAREQAPEEPEVYLQRASIASIAGKSGYEEARQVFKDGLKKVPSSKAGAIYEALANLELRAGHLGKAIEVLELGVNARGIELQLMPSLKDASKIPADGENLIIVASVENELHFRIFDLKGKKAVDTDETKLKQQAKEIDETRLTERKEQIEELRKRLEKIWATRAEDVRNNDKNVIISNVLSLVNYKMLAGQAGQTNLRMRLAELLARHGETGKLLIQIEELGKAGSPPLYIRYLNACYYINSHQFLKARQILMPLQAVMNRISLAWLKTRINLLLAQCYGELGEPEMQQEALLKALSADPQDVTARINWINHLISQGDTAGAIKEYRSIVKQAPQVRPMLARLLIGQNQRRPEAQRDWSEVNELINGIDETGSISGERAILKAELLVAQGNQAGACGELEKAQSRFPKSAEIRIAQASLAGSQGRVEEALGLLDQAKEQLGDRVDLRLERARLWASKKGPEVLKALMELSQGVEGFSKVDQKRLLNGLALELFRQEDHDGASQLWTRLAALDPANIGLRVNLVDLALESANKDDIEKNIKQIEEIEGSEGLLGRYCQVRYLIWQAKRARDKETRRANQAKARGLLEDLASRRGDWSVIPLVSAELAQQELDQSDLKGEELRAKEESIINYYLQAIKLGQRRAAVVRRTVELLFKTEQVDRALELLSTIPVEQLAGADRQAAQIAMENRDFEHALQIARKAVQANPGDFKERSWLAHILFASEQRDEAVKELRDAVNLSPDDPDRWVALVNMMILAKQVTGVEAVIKDAEAKLPPSKAPFALGKCCERMGRAYDGTDSAEMKKWNDAARSWYEKAEAIEPADLSIKRRFTDFLLQSRQIDEAQKYLEAIRTQAGGAWVNRTLALVLANGSDQTQRNRALAIFEPDGKLVPAGEEGKILERKNLGDPEDLRVLARVLDLQRTVVHRKRAIEILETLAEKNLATNEDRFVVARLYEAIGDGQKAREKYFQLNLRTRNLRDAETFNRRPLYLAQFARNLLRDCKPSDKEELAEAQEVVDELKQLQPAALETLFLQVEIYRIRNEVDQAVELIQAFVSNPKLHPDAIAAIGDLAEKMKQIPLAEQLFRRVADLPNTIRGKLRLAEFLGRQDRITEGLKICELLWNTPEADHVGATCIDILYGSAGKTRTVESGDIDRVSNWFEQAIARLQQNQHLGRQRLLTGLGNLREKQDRISEAEILYHRAIQESEGDGVSLNNLAWLLAVRKDPKRIKEALDYANRALTLKPEQPDFLDTRGMVYLVDARPKLAIDDFQHAVTIDPSSPSKYFHLAQACLAAGDKNRAKQSLDMAKGLGLTPNSLHALERQNYQNVLDALGSP